MRLPICVVSVATILAAFNPARGDLLYVDDDAPPDGDGLSWKTAFADLQDALATAAGDPNVTEIRVGQGTYTPAGPGGSRDATFQLLTGVAILGGYTGFGAFDPDERDPTSFITVLSGDLNADDGPDFQNNGENSYTVVTGSGVDATAVLDGCTVASGNADGSGPGRQSGGGIYIDDGGPTVNGCTFQGNWAATAGGGLYMGGNMSPTLTHCTFVDNSSDAEGGGVRTVGGGSMPLIADCIFMGNSAYIGGAVSNDSSSIFVNCVFVENTASSGGALYAWSQQSLTDCVFIDNLALDDGGGIYDSRAGLMITNCVFLSNESHNEGGGIFSFHPLAGRGVSRVGTI